MNKLIDKIAPWEFFTALKERDTKKRRVTLPFLNAAQMKTLFAKESISTKDGKVG